MEKGFYWIADCGKEQIVHTGLGTPILLVRRKNGEVDVQQISPDGKKQAIEHYILRNQKRHLAYTLSGDIKKYHESNPVRTINKNGKNYTLGNSVDTLTHERPQTGNFFVTDQTIGEIDYGSFYVKKRNSWSIIPVRFNGKFSPDFPAQDKTLMHSFKDYVPKELRAKGY
jgi:hypothetical protein